jgi:hypothetical protein
MAIRIDPVEFVTSALRNSVRRHRWAALVERDRKTGPDWAYGSRAARRL